jgi:hypothetical protein
VNGRTYRYSNVPAHIHEQLLKAELKGTFSTRTFIANCKSTTGIGASHRPAPMTASAAGGTKDSCGLAQFWL